MNGKRLGWLQEGDTWSMADVLTQIDDDAWDLDIENGDEFSSDDSDTENDGSGGIHAYHYPLLGYTGACGGGCEIQGVTKVMRMWMCLGLVLVVCKMLQAPIKSSK